MPADKGTIESLLHIITGKQLIKALAWEDEVTINDVKAAHPEIIPSAIYPEDAYTTTNRTKPYSKNDLAEIMKAGC